MTTYLTLAGLSLITCANFLMLWTLYLDINWSKRYFTMFVILGNFYVVVSEGYPILKGIVG
jgi:hypothetical protein